MAQVYMCDRCRTADVDVTLVLDFDLCPRCVVDARAWLRGPLRPRKPKRRTLSTELASIVARLLSESREITPESLGAVMSKSRREAYYTLQHLTRKGELERHRRGREIVFTRRAQEAAE